MMTDPIADLLTRIRNAVAIERPSVDVPYSRLKQGVVEVLKREGFVWDHEVIDGQPAKTLRISLKYGPNGERIVQEIQRVSRPGRRVFAAAKEMPNVLQGLGICVVSTNQGLLSNREARTKGVGGEILCTVW